MGRVGQPGYPSADAEVVIARAVRDVILLRQEMRKHDLEPARLRDDLMAAAIPAFIAMEADRVIAERPKVRDL